VTRAIINDVLGERARQDALYGPPALRGYSADRWLRVLMEEVGEVARALENEDPENLMTELTQVAAVAVAMIEALR
jgi:NTP pyrophosphatase (non-canonical NTP hydrolase)